MLYIVSISLQWTSRGNLHRKFISYVFFLSFGNILLYSSRKVRLMPKMFYNEVNFSEFIFSIKNIFAVS